MGRGLYKNYPDNFNALIGELASELFEQLAKASADNAVRWLFEDCKNPEHDHSITAIPKIDCKYCKAKLKDSIKE